MEKDRFKFMRDNYGWILALVTSGGVLVLNILRFIEYIKSTVYFSYYGIDMNLYKFDDKNVIYDLSLSIILLLATISVLYCVYQLSNNIKNKKIFNYENVLNIVIVILYNCFLIISTTDTMTLSIFVGEFIMLLFIQWIGSKLIFSELKDKETDKEKRRIMFINYLKTLPFVIIILLFLMMIILLEPISSRKSYRVINNNKVIVYSNSEYYIILDCEIVDNNLIIYSGRQEKINNTDVYSVYKTFNNIEIKQ